MRCHMKKCIRKAAAAVLSAALLVTSESPAFAQNIQQTAVPADVITEQSRLEDGIAQTGYISDSFSEKRQEVQKEDTEGLLKSAAEQLQDNTGRSSCRRSEIREVMEHAGHFQRLHAWKSI